MSSFLYQLGNNANLSLKELTMMLAMILAFVLAHHSSDLARLSVMRVHDLTGLAKQSKTRSCRQKFGHNRLF